MDNNNYAKARDEIRQLIAKGLPDLKILVFLAKELPDLSYDERKKLIASAQ